MTADDDRLLETLAAALSTPAAEPSAAELAMLRATVSAPREVVAVTPLLRPQPRRFRALVVLGAAAAVVVALLLSVQGGAPGESSDVGRAEASLTALRNAVDGGDRSATARALATAEARLRELTTSERAGVEPEASAVLRDARELLAAPTPATTTTTVGPPPSPTTATPTSIDDNGGDRSGKRFDRSRSNSGSG